MGDKVARRSGYQKVTAQLGSNAQYILDHLCRN